MSINTIGVCGLGWTGSGAVVDLLKEYDENEFFDGFEFNICYLPNGLLDLDYHLNAGSARFYSGDYAVTQFRKYIKRIEERKYRSGIYNRTNGKFCDISKAYIEDIVQLEWKGTWDIDSIYSSRFQFFWKYMVFDRFIKPSQKLHKLVERKMQLCISPDDFELRSKKYVRDLIGALGASFTKNIVLDQPFPANNPQLCFKFFDNPKAIIVDRDPRDLYLLMKNVVHTTGIIPTDSVEEFVEYFKYTHRANNLQNSDHVLHLKFEDLIYNYDESVNRIEKFLSISKHSRKKAGFDPSVSINNTQLISSYPKYKDDILYIEKELKEYLYDFPFKVKSDTSHSF